MREEKSFTQRLTKEQIETFFERVYPKETHSYCYYLDDQVYFPHREKYIYALIYSTKAKFDWEVILQSYEASVYNEEWINYLYEIFGEEYKQAYLNRCAEIFDKKYSTKEYKYDESSFD